MTDKPTNCDGCGLCCMGQNLVPLSDISLERLGGFDEASTLIPARLVAELEATIRGPLSGDDTMPCVWLDRSCGKCAHHDYRPSVCREFEVGCEACLKYRRLSRERLAKLG